MQCVHESEDLIFLKCQFLPNWPTNSVKSQSKSQHSFLPVVIKKLLLNSYEKSMWNSQNNFENKKQWIDIH